ncbi:hypothetical protein [Streptomyces sp. NPDC059468]|uniref:hypothetical protein n=1 Tax=Streptomyces sp. NPDC059468 TaxID=3346845 RepID=UPI0036A3CFF4
MGHHAPGYIKTTKEAVRAHYAAKGVDIDAKITAHIKLWADSVPVGTMVSIFKMLTYDVTCNCPPGPWEHQKKCRGFAHGMPVELVMDIVFPPDGSPCQVPGVTGRATQGPLIEHGLGLIKYIEKTA